MYRLASVAKPQRALLMCMEAVIVFLNSSGLTTNCGEVTGLENRIIS